MWGTRTQVTESEQCFLHRRDRPTSDDGVNRTETLRRSGRERVGEVNGAR